MESLLLLVRVILSHKGPIINYGEGGYTMGKSRVRNFLHPTSRQGKNFRAPPPFLRVKTFCAPPPPSIWLKLFVPTFSMGNTFYASPFRRGKTSHAFFSSCVAPLSVISDQSNCVLEHQSSNFFHGAKIILRPLT